MFVCEYSVFRFAKKWYESTNLDAQSAPVAVLAVPFADFAQAAMSESVAALLLGELEVNPLVIS
jgi:hypothetical protein